MTESAIAPAGTVADLRAPPGGRDNRAAVPNADMTPIAAISLSGMTAAQSALRASAHNVANLASAGFRRQQAAPATVAEGGVTTALSQASQAGNALETDVVGQLVAKNQFLANLAVFRTGDRMMGSLLDATG